MAEVVWGIVRQGVVVPHTSLPEGALVQIVPASTEIPLSPELQDEIAAWNEASDRALELVERLAQEAGDDVQG